MAERLKHPFVWLALLMAAGGGGYWYWQHGRQYEATENAYVNAHIVHVAAQVTGQVVSVIPQENQLVQQGTTLLTIDPAPFQIAVERASAQLQKARFQVKRSVASLRDAEALVRQREAELRNAIANDERTQNLLTRNLVSKEKADLSATQLSIAQAALESSQARLAAEHANLGSGGDQNESVREAAAALEQAKLDLSNCEVKAPVTGNVANLTVRAGDVIARNQQLFALIDASESWIDANFKETQLAEIKPGDEAEIRIDMYRDKVFKGQVDSISGGSGTAFSLLPAQNATGNWVKIAQRVPVKIKVLDPDPKFPLRIGTSGSVRVKIAKP
jgi:membrane fusion protein (multidrug efflux system)